MLTAMRGTNLFLAGTARCADWRTLFKGHPTNGSMGGLIIQIDKVKPQAF
jgi:hypothetical protein